MVSSKVLIVFILPVLFSFIFGFMVLSNVLQQPDRELNMWPMSHSEEFSSNSSQITIIGLSQYYSTSEQIEIQVKIDDFSYDCGDLYVTIYSENHDPIVQSGFFEQCFENGQKFLPINDRFFTSIGDTGSYEIVIEMISKDLQNISTSEIFTIK
jgi:hypothetical protein